MKAVDSGAVKLGLIQSSCAAEPGENLRKTVALVEKAARQGAQIICTQELFRSRASASSESTAHWQLLPVTATGSTGVIATADGGPGPTARASVPQHCRRWHWH